MIPDRQTFFPLPFYLIAFKPVLNNGRIPWRCISFLGPEYPSLDSETLRPPFLLSETSGSRGTWFSETIRRISLSSLPIGDSVLVRSCIRVCSAGGIDLLERQLEQANERGRENRRTIAGLVQRVPELEAVSEPRDTTPETSSEGSAGGGYGYGQLAGSLGAPVLVM